MATAVSKGPTFLGTGQLGIGQSFGASQLRGSLRATRVLNNTDLGLQTQTCLASPQQQHHLAQAPDGRCEYYSTTHQIWIPTKITATDDKTGAVQIDKKPGVWISPTEQKTRLRVTQAALERAAKDRHDGDPAKSVSASSNISVKAGMQMRTVPASSLSRSNAPDSSTKQGEATGYPPTRLAGSWSSSPGPDWRPEGFMPQDSPTGSYNRNGSEASEARVASSMPSMSARLGPRHSPGTTQELGAAAASDLSPVNTRLSAATSNDGWAKASSSTRSPIVAGALRPAVEMRTVEADLNTAASDASPSSRILFQTPSRLTPTGGRISIPADTAAAAASAQPVFTSSSGVASLESSPMVFKSSSGAASLEEHPSMVGLTALGIIARAEALSTSSPSATATVRSADMTRTAGPPRTFVPPSTPVTSAAPVPSTPVHEPLTREVRHSGQSPTTSSTSTQFIFEPSASSSDPAAVPLNSAERSPLLPETTPLAAPKLTEPSKPLPQPTPTHEDAGSEIAPDSTGGPRTDNPLPLGDAICYDMYGRPTIVRQINPDSGAARTVVLNDDGSHRVFGENTVASLTNSNKDESKTWLNTLSCHQIRGLVHEVGQRLLEGSRLYHARVSQLDKMGENLNYIYFGLTADASDRDLENAYRKLAKKLHPDKNGGTEAAKKRFQQMKERYEAIKKKRGEDCEADTDEDGPPEDEDEDDTRKLKDRKRKDQDDEDAAAKEEDAADKTSSIEYDPQDHESMFKTVTKMLGQLKNVELQMKVVVKELRRVNTQLQTATS